MDEVGEDYDVGYSNIIHKPRNSLTLSSDNTTDEDILLTPPNGSSSSVEFCLTPEPRRVERNLFNHQRIRLHHSTPLFMNNFSNCSQNPQTAWHVAGPSNPYPRRVKSVLDVELPVEYVNPFTPDGKMIVNKVKAQQRLYSLTLNPVGRKIDLNDDDAEQSSVKSDPSSSKEDSLVNDMTSIKDESFVNCDFELPMRSRLSEFNVSRFNEEFIQLNEIGKGHHGCVFKCLNKMNGCVYAVKRTIKPVRSSLQERIIRNEIYAHGALDHPNIVRNFSSWKEEEFVYIQNEFCNGGSLDAYIEKKTMSEPLVLTLLMHIASALRFIHEKGLAHMDVKPANILLCIDNSKARRNNDIDDGFGNDETDSIVFKLADFGHISKLDEKYDVEEGDCRYMPREILQDNLSCIDRADIFSLGLTAYEVAGGGPLPKNGKKWQDIRNGKLRNLSQHSEHFNELIATLTRPEPEKRPSAAELVQMLNYNPSPEDLMGYFNQARNKKALLDHNVKTVEKYMTYMNSRVRKQIQEKSAALSAKKRGAVTKTKFVNRRIKRSSSTTLF